MALVLEWLRTGQLQLPLPGSGQTAQRWHQRRIGYTVDAVAAAAAQEIVALRYGQWAGAIPYGIRRRGRVHRPLGSPAARRREGTVSD